MTIIGKDIKKAIDFLKKGELVAIPTETVYGLAANALEEKSVKKIFEAKERPFFNPLIIHTNSLEKINEYVEELPEKAVNLIKNFSPGPITFVLKKTKKIPDIVTGGNDTVAIRIPKHDLTLSLLSELDFPLAAPSANPFGFISPTKAIHVFEQLNKKVSYILDGGDCEVGLESTIIYFGEKTPKILRFGGIEVEKIEAIIGKVNILEKIEKNIIAPGQLKSHYAPKHKFIITDIDKFLLETDINKNNIGILSFNKKYDSIPISNQIILSKESNLHEAGSKLFDSLRELDKLNVEIIVSEIFPNIGIGKAINDRLKRASSS